MDGAGQQTFFFFFFHLASLVICFFLLLGDGWVGGQDRRVSYGSIRRSEGTSIDR